MDDRSFAQRSCLLHFYRLKWDRNALKYNAVIMNGLTVFMIFLPACHPGKFSQVAYRIIRCVIMQQTCEFISSLQDLPIAHIEVKAVILLRSFSTPSSVMFADWDGATPVLWIITWKAAWVLHSECIQGLTEPLNWNYLTWTFLFPLQQPCDTEGCLGIAWNPWSGWNGMESMEWNLSCFN